MILYDAKGHKFYGNKTKPPSFSCHRGRTWDYETKRIDGTEFEFWSDTSWGFRYYFKIEKQWYVMHHFKGPKGEQDGGDAIDVYDFSTSSPTRIETSLEGAA